MDKRLAAVALALLLGPTPWAAGIRYSGTVRTEGGPKISAEDREAMRKMGMGGDGVNFDFEVLAESGRVRQNFLSDFAFFKKGDYMLGDSTTKTAAIVMPSRNEYSEMDLAGLEAVCRQMMTPVKMTYSDTEVDVQEMPPTVVNGYPCTGKRVHLTYTATVEAAGVSTKSHTDETTEYHTTRQFEVHKYFGNNTWHKMGIQTGDAEFDRMIAAKIGGGLGFPVEIRIQKVVDGEGRGATVLSVRDIEPVPVIAPGTFNVPAGFAKTPFDPLRRMGAQGAKGEGEELPPETPDPEKTAKKLGEAN
jgi:hypothetical protein